MAALADAYAECQRLAAAHYENFPVASRLLPPAMRPHIAAIYAFARTADDIADEGDLPAGERLARLDEWEAQLDRQPVHPIFIALHDTIRVCRLDAVLFRDLVSAFRQDVTVHTYERWDDLLDYCRRSANPIGRLVLGVAGAAGAARLDDAAALAESDAVCTALQLANHWQDRVGDLSRGRDYLPAELTRQYGENALAEACRRTRVLFHAGRGIAGRVRGRLAWELRATWLGGVRILDRLEAAGFDGARPALGAADAAAIGWKMLTWR